MPIGPHTGALLFPARVPLFYHNVFLSAGQISSSALYFATLAQHPELEHCLQRI